MEPLIQKLGITKDEAKRLSIKMTNKRNLGDEEHHERNPNYRDGEYHEGVYTAHVHDDNYFETDRHNEMYYDWAWRR